MNAEKGARILKKLLALLVDRSGLVAGVMAQVPDSDAD